MWATSPAASRVPTRRSSSRQAIRSSSRTSSASARSRSEPSGVPTATTLEGRPGGLVDVGAGDHREPRRPPGLEAALHVGRALEAELLQRRGGEARLVALVADEDHVPVQVAAERRFAVARRRIEAPLEHVAGYEVRSRDHAVALALELRADVEEKGAGAGRLARRHG